jgi:UrcA family protein
MIVGPPRQKPKATGLEKMEDEMTKFLIATAATLTAAILPAATASAQAAPQVQTIQVSYSDLDLRTAAGRQALDARLRTASLRLCANGTQGGMTVQFQRQQCLRDAHFSARSGARIAIARAQTGEIRDAVLASR